MELGLLGIIGVAVLSKRMGVAAPLILVVVGIVLSFVPGVPSFSTPGTKERILTGVLPPLLYAAAIKTPVTDFRRNLTPIASLSVALVVVSTLATGLLLHALLPGLGAVISLPDAVAATSIGRRLGLPPRLLTVLEGEGSRPGGRRRAGPRADRHGHAQRVRVGEGPAAGAEARALAAPPVPGSPARRARGRT